MSFYSVTIDSKALDRQLQVLGTRDQFAAVTRSLRRGQTTMRKTAVEEVQRELNIKSKAVRDAVDVSRVGRRGLSAQVRIVSKGEEAIGFNRTRQVGTGVSLQVKKRGGRKVIRGAFITTLRSGKKSVFKRRIDPTSKKRVGRLPIDIVYTTSVRQALSDRASQQRIIQAGRDRFVRELRREVRHLLEKRS